VDIRALAGTTVNIPGQGFGGHLGSAPGMASWAEQNGLVPASAKTLPMYGGSADASAWVPPVDGINPATVFGRDGISCGVSAQGPDIDLIRSLFVSVLENVRRSGVLVEKEVDREVVRSNVRVQQVAFRLRAETSQANRPDRIFVLTANTITDRRFPVVAIASHVQGR